MHSGLRMKYYTTAITGGSKLGREFGEEVWKIQEPMELQHKIKNKRINGETDGIGKH